MIKTIIFDLDGTLLYTLPDLTNALNHALKTNSLPLVSIEQTKQALGYGPLKLVEKITNMSFENPKFSKIYEDYLAYYNKHNNDETTVYPKIQELLLNLKQNNYKLAVLSNKQNNDTQAVINHYFPNIFDIVIGTSEKVKKKPSTDGLIIIVTDLNTTKDNCLYIGDSEVDVITAKNADMQCIIVTYGYRSKQQLIAAGATNFIDNPMELINYLN